MLSLILARMSLNASYLAALTFAIWKDCYSRSSLHFRGMFCDYDLKHLTFDWIMILLGLHSDEDDWSAYEREYGDEFQISGYGMYEAELARFSYLEPVIA